MKKSLVMLTGFGLIFLMLVLPMVLAVDINVRAVSGHRASVTVLGAGETYEFLDSFHMDTGNNGEIKVVYTGGKEMIDVLVKITKDGEAIINEKFEDLSTVNPLHLQVIPGKVSSDYKKLDEEKAAAEAARIAALEAEKAAAENPVEEVEEKNEKVSEGGVTGSAISDFELKIPKSLYYIVGGLLVVGLLAFFGLKYGGSVKGGKPSVLGPNNTTSGGGMSSAERKLEEQLKGAQKEIVRLKKEEQNIVKVAEVERKLEADKEELRKLRSGE